MFKPNRLVWKEAGKKWYQKGILSPMGSIASGIASIGGKCLQRFGRGALTTMHTPGAVTGTFDEITQSEEITLSNVGANLAAPITVLEKSQKGFKDKIAEALGEVWHSTIKTTPKALFASIASPLGTFLGADIKRNKEGKLRPAWRSKRGVSGMASRAVFGAAIMGTFWTGLEAQDPNQHSIAAQRDQAERMDRLDNWTKPRYLKGSKDGKK